MLAIGAGADLDTGELLTLAVKLGIWGWLFGLIGGVIRDIAGIVVRVVRAVMPVVQVIIDGIKAVIVEIGTNAGRFFRYIAGAVRSFYDAVVKPIVDAVRIGFERFRQFLNKVFSPILKVFDRINDFLDTVWSKIIAPILEVLDRLRFFFRLLAELGLDWAGAVDRFLERIQTEIYNAFREVRTWVNTATQWFDLLLDPRGWIKSTPFLMTIWKFGGNVLNLITTLGAVDPQRRARLDDWQRSHAPRPMSRAVEKFRAGELARHGGIQGAAARFRSGQTPDL